MTTATNSEFYKIRLQFTLLNFYKRVKNDFLQRIKLFMTRIFFPLLMLQQIKLL